MRINQRVVIVGEAPGRRDAGTTPLFGTSGSHAGWRLREIVGLTRSQWTEVRRVNLFATLPDRWDVLVASITARAWMHALLRDHHVVCCGRRVARAFACDDLELMTWRRVDRHAMMGPCTIGCIPHPSGRSLAYNDARVRTRASLSSRCAAGERVMFDKTFVIPETRAQRHDHHHRHETTVHEHRAPTDASMELLEEMRQKALNSIVVQFPVSTSLGDAVCTILRDGSGALGGAWTMHARFVLNDQALDVSASESEHVIAAMRMRSGPVDVRDHLLRLIFDKLAHHIAEKLLLAALDNPLSRANLES